MKKVFLFIFTICLSFSAFAQDWDTLNTNKTAGLTEVTILNEKNFIAVGAEAVVVKSIEGGDTWNDLNVLSTSDSWETGKFLGEKTGFVGGQFQDLYKTTDGGDTWTLESESESFWAVNSVVGFRGGNSGLCQSTSDSGSNWVDVNLGTTESLLDLLFIDDSTGYIVGNNEAFFTTTDQGVTWISITLTTNHLYSIVEKDSLILISGLEGTIFTNDSRVKTNNSNSVEALSQKASGIYPKPASTSVIVVGGWGSYALFNLAGSQVTSGQLTSNVINTSKLTSG